MTSTAVIMNSASSSVRVMLVDDSAVVRGMVRKWLENVPGLEIVEGAANGQKAIDMVSTSRPDIIILDIEMPVMDGLTALPTILRKVPEAKVLIASTLSRRNAEISLKAMSLGASDYVAKPSFARDGADARAAFQEELIRKVTGLADATRRANGTPEIIGRRSGAWAPMPDKNTAFRMRNVSRVKPKILVIGASTGGPNALSTVIEASKAALGNIPVLIAQHMPPTFTALLGDKLAAMANLEGGEAVHGAPIIPGKIYVAPGGMHMRVRRHGGEVVVALDTGPPINHCRPAVDPMFETVAQIYGAATLCAVLTGMGSDGAQGAVKIADAGGTVIAQDEASSVVWGMPGATAAAGACADIVSLNEMGSRLSRVINQGAKI